MSLTRITVNLVPKAQGALEEAMKLAGDSQSDTVNRAVQAYAWLLRLKYDGDDLIIRHPDGTSEKIIMM